MEGRRSKRNKMVGGKFIGELSLHKDVKTDTMLTIIGRREGRLYRKPFHI